MILSLHSRAQALQSTLWAMVVPPTAWAVHFLFCYIYAAVRCAKSGPVEVIGDVRIGIAIATVVALALIGISGFVAWAQSRIEGDPPPHQESTDEDRTRFLAVATLLLAGLSFVATLFTAIPAFIFEDCG
jgi:nitrate reductase NapE component